MQVSCANFWPFYLHIDEEAMSKTIIVSNRLPVKVTEEDGQYKVATSEGGLATGLGSVYQSGDNVWLGWPGVEVAGDDKQNEVIQKLAEVYGPFF